MVGSMATPDDVRAVALAEFSSTGYLGTSIARIAERSGVSKASVLYHYASKEALLDAVIAPAIDAMERVLARGIGSDDGGRAGFIEDFVGLLLSYRLEVNIFINQRRSLVDVPVIERANDLVVRLTHVLDAEASTLTDHLRFGIALGGAAYCLATAGEFDEIDYDNEQLRAALLDVLGELLAAPAGRN
jgi:TetR/AcrR family transcriptional regulator